MARRSARKDRRCNLCGDVVASLGLACTIALILALPSFAQRQPFPDDTVSQLVTATLYQYFDPESRFEVSASGSRLGEEALFIDELFISGKPAILHGLRGEVLTRIVGLEVDLAAFTRQSFQARRVRQITVVSKTTAAAVQAALSRFSSSVASPTISFEEGSFTVKATIRREGSQYPMEARGTLQVVMAQRVNVALSEVKVSGGSVPLDLVDRELTRINPIVDLAKWPIPLYVQRLVLHKDAIELLATNTH